MAHVDKGPATRKSSASLWGWIFGLAAVVVVVWIVVEAFETDNKAERRTAEGGRVTVENIIDNPGAYAGKTVVVQGEVEETYTGGGFVISGKKWGFDEKLLVVSAGPGRAFATHTGVQITGTVRTFTIADIEREMSIDLDDTLLAGYAGKPVLLASTVELIENK